MVDSTVIRAHPCAAGQNGGTQSQDPGRSKGGFTTRIHLRTNGHGLPVKAGTPVIPARRNRTDPQPIDGVIHALRDRIARCISRPKNARRRATRYDKTATSVPAFIRPDPAPESVDTT